MNDLISSIPQERLIGATIIFLAFIVNTIYTAHCLWKKKPLSTWRFFNNLFGIGSIMYAFIIFLAIVFPELNKFLDLSVVYGSAGFAMLIVGLMSFGVKFDTWGNENK